VSSVTATSATLTATVNPVYIGGTFTYNYGRTSSYGSSTPAQPLVAGQPGQPAIANLTGLSPSTTYHFQVVITTPDGTASSGDVTFTTAQPQSPPLTRAQIAGAKLTNTRFRVGQQATAVAARRRKAPAGTTVVFSLSAPANVKLTITRTLPGRRSGRRCVASTARLARKHARASTRTVPAGTLSRANQAAGTDRIPFTGRIGRRALGTGNYSVALVASNAAGSSNVVVLPFAIVK
jgi:hypothetical protein